MTYTVEFTPKALEMMEEIEDARVRKKLFERIQKLADEPEKQGKPLVEGLAGLRSVRAVGQRYRIVYEVQGRLVRVIVVGVGLRKEGHRIDVYVRLGKFFNRG